MIKWQYVSGYELDEGQLNDAGAKGWELVSVCQTAIPQVRVFYFKRPIEIMNFFTRIGVAALKRQVSAAIKLRSERRRNLIVLGSLYEQTIQAKTLNFAIAFCDIKIQIIKAIFNLKITPEINEN